MRRSERSYQEGIKLLFKSLSIHFTQYITCSQFAFEGLVVGKFRVECTDLGPDSRLTLTNLYGHAWHMAVALMLKQGRTCEDVDGRNCNDEPYCG